MCCKSRHRCKNAMSVSSLSCLVTQRPTSVAPAMSVPLGFASYQAASSSLVSGDKALAPTSGGMSWTQSGIFACDAASAARMIGAYPVQRHRFPANASSKSRRPLRCAVTIEPMKPGVQNPHCDPWCSTMASCTGCSAPSGPLNPSTVRTALPCSCGRKRMQAFNARAPLLSVTMTVHAPQSPSLQPSLVPVIARVSRSQSSRVTVGVSSVSSTVSPFRRNLMLMLYARRGTICPECAASMRRRSDTGGRTHIWQDWRNWQEFSCAWCFNDFLASLTQVGCGHDKCSSIHPPTHTY